MDEQLLSFIKKRHAFDQWRNRNTLDKNLFVWKFYFSSDNLTGWKAQRIERIDTEAPPPQAVNARAGRVMITPPALVRSVWECPEEKSEAVHRIQKIEDPSVNVDLESAPSDSVTAPERPACIKSFWKNAEGRPESLLNFNIYECASRENAHEFLLILLSQFQSPLLTRRDDIQIGDVTFAMPGGTVVIFARGNLVHLVRNAGREIVSVEDAAKEFDSELVSKPDSAKIKGKSAVVPLISSLRVSAKKIRVGAGTPLDIEASDPLGADVPTPLRARASAPLLPGSVPQTRPIMYKVFSSLSGRVYREQERLFYRADEAGPQKVTVIAINANRGASSNELSLIAE